MNPIEQRDYCYEIAKWSNEELHRPNLSGSMDPIEVYVLKTAVARILSVDIIDRYESKKSLLIAFGIGFALSAFIAVIGGVF